MTTSSTLPISVPPMSVSPKSVSPMSVSPMSSSRALAAPPADRASLFDRPVVLGALLAFGLAAFFWRQPAADVVLHLSFPDNDDTMRLVQVRDLLAGQGWFDTVQHRFLPPEGGSMHWSRLIDLPIAGLILALRPWLGAPLAEGMAAALWPSLLFLLFLGVTGAIARRFLTWRAAVFAVYVAAASPTAAGLFQFGRIDHHNVQAIVALAAAALLAAPRPDGRYVSWLPWTLAGALVALSLAIGLETLPLAAGAGAAAVTIWVLDGAPASRAMAGFALALAGGTLFLFVAQTAPERWFLPQCDALSPPWLLLTSGAGMGTLALAAAPLATPLRRLAAAAALGVFLLALLGTTFPACLSGPYSTLPSIVTNRWLSAVSEAMPAWKTLLVSPATALGNVGPILAAACVASWAALRAEPRLRRVFAVWAAFLWSAALVSAIQIRGVFIGFVFVPLVGGWALDRVVNGLRTPASPWRRAGSLAVALSVFGQVWASPVLALQVLNKDWASDPGESPLQGCTGASALRPLDRLSPGIVLAQIDLGTSLLLRTRHDIVAAPYHRNVAGLVASLEAFSGSEAAMRRQVEAQHADYVAICPAWLRPEEQGGFARKLLDGATTPWLVPVPMKTSPLKVWRVSRP